MDISICFADFPTEKIGETTRAFRQLGIGYANLGALLMATGHAYDSEGGRAIAAGDHLADDRHRLQALAPSWPASSVPTTATRATRPPHQRVMRKHAAANDLVRTVGADDDRELLDAGQPSGRRRCGLGEANG